MPKTYECPICYGINSVARMNCQYCGAVPKVYSIIGSVMSFGKGIELVPAKECDRTERHRTCKRVLATVPADYYAEVE